MYMFPSPLCTACTLDHTVDTVHWIVRAPRRAGAHAYDSMYLQYVHSEIYSYFAFQFEKQTF